MTTHPVNLHAASDQAIAEPNATRLKPVHEIRIGRIKAAIWENLLDNRHPESGGGRKVMHNVTVQRLYRDPQNEKVWRTSESFGRDDLPLVERVLHLAFEWIYELPEPPEIRR